VKLQDCEITLEDSIVFSELSGDRNPIHLDPLAARRLIYGKPVVHGVHLSLKLLEHLLTGGRDVPSPRRIRARFNAPLFHDTSAVASVAHTKPNKSRMSLHAGVQELGWVEVEAPVTGGPRASDIPKLRADEETHPVLLAGGDIASHAGSVDLSLDRDTYAKLFPALAALHGWDGIVSILLASTYIVGMLCPGMNSLLASFDLSAPEGNTQVYGNDALNYRVKRHDPRFNSVVIEVQTGPWTGTINAFVRPAPAVQPSYGEVCDEISARQWQDRHALVVGGSRGLGEVAAKIVCAAGGRCTLTYQKGADDAQRVRDEIIDGGGSAETLQLDVEGDIASQLGTAPAHAVTDILYFPSPHISPSLSGDFDQVLFDKYMRVYVYPLAPLLAVLTERSTGSPRIFWPSSAYIDKPVRGFAEYAAAKGAGEAICRWLVLDYPDAEIRVPRLPPMRTDQTLSIVPVKIAEPLDVLCGELLADPEKRSHAQPNT